jgi:hypothetical protein
VDRFRQMLRYHHATLRSLVRRVVRWLLSLFVKE